MNSSATYRADQNCCLLLEKRFRLPGLFSSYNTVLRRLIYVYVWNLHRVSRELLYVSMFTLSLFLRVECMLYSIHPFRSCIYRQGFFGYILLPLFVLALSRCERSFLRSSWISEYFHHVPLYNGSIGVSSFPRHPVVSRVLSLWCTHFAPTHRCTYFRSRHTRSLLGLRTEIISDI